MNSLVKQTNNPLLLVPQSLEQLQTVAQMIARSDLAPKDYKGKPENVAVAIARCLAVRGSSQKELE